jgi:hypothetical protein
MPKETLQKIFKSVGVEGFLELGYQLAGPGIHRPEK